MPEAPTDSDYSLPSEILRRAVSGFFFCVLAGAIGCQTGVMLPPLPNWIEVKQPIPAVAVANEARRLIPGIIVSYSDNTYTLVSKDWLDAYLTWTWEASKAAGVSYTPESFDCEDFALGFHFFAARAAGKAGAKASPLIARVVVAQESAQGPLRHELIGVATDKGVFIVEPQTASPFRIWPLGVYPHKILSATFGDFNPN
jgi:hypothetical protein